MKKKSFVPYIVAFCLFVSAVGFMVYSGLNEGSVYFLNVSEALTLPVEENKAMRLFGSVDTFERNTAGNKVDFILVDAEQPTQTMRVSYEGVIPDTFEQGVEVILEGNMRTGYQFQAKTLMTKCPSKYEKENRT